MSQDTNTPTIATEATGTAEPCKMGCGFFGSPGNSGCCSNCWEKAQQEQEHKATTTNPLTAATTDTTTTTMSTAITRNKKRRASPSESEETPIESPKKRMRIEEPVVFVDAAATITKPSIASKTKKFKKTKKFSSILKNMMKANKKDVEKEKEALRKGLGGGEFEKIAKI